MRGTCSARVAHDGGSKLHRESTGGRLEGEVVSEDLHDVVTVGSELLVRRAKSARAESVEGGGRETHSNDEHGSSEDENPDGNGVLLGGELSGGPDVVDGGVGADGVGDLWPKGSARSFGEEGSPLLTSLEPWPNEAVQAVRT